MKIIAKPKQRRTGNVHTMADEQRFRVDEADGEGNLTLVVTTEILVLNGRYDFCLEFSGEEVETLAKLSAKAKIRALQKRIAQMEAAQAQPLRE